jgi:hypothetical protein
LGQVAGAVLVVVVRQAEQAVLQELLMVVMLAVRAGMPALREVLVLVAEVEPQQY